MPTTEEKYEWLCTKLSVANVDLFEKDGMIILTPPIYFQLDSNSNAIPTVDEAVTAAMTDEIGRNKRWKKQKKSK